MDVAKESLAAANALYENDRQRLEAGVLARLDVVTAEAQVSASQRDLIVAQTNVKIGEARLKSMLTKKVDEQLDAAEVVVTDRLPEPQENDIPDLRMTLRSALTRRPTCFRRKPTWRIKISQCVSPGTHCCRNLARLDYGPAPD